MYLGKVVEVAPPRICTSGRSTRTPGASSTPSPTRRSPGAAGRSLLAASCRRRSTHRRAADFVLVARWHKRYARTRSRCCANLVPGTGRPANFRWARRWTRTQRRARRRCRMTDGCGWRERAVNSPGERRYREGGSFEDEAGYSRAVRHGQLIAVSGTTCREEAIRLGTHAQVVDCLWRIVGAVERLGGSRTDIYRTRLFLAPGADWREAGRGHLEVLGDVAPANTTLFVHGLIGDGLLVEAEAEAWLDADALADGTDDDETSGSREKEQPSTATSAPRRLASVSTTTCRSGTSPSLRLLPTKLASIKSGSLTTCSGGQPPC
jgi:enamine deaminase RidA (YjgF/YER057c/UK114 family)